MYKKIIQKFQFSAKQICLCALGFRTITQTGSSKVAILFLLIIVQSENSIAFSLFCLSNQVTVFSVVLDTSYFRMSPRPVRLQAGQEQKMRRWRRRILLLFAFVWALCVVIYIYKSGDDEVSKITPLRMLGLYFFWLPQMLFQH